MVVLYYVVFIQFAVIVWLVYDKLKRAPKNRGYMGRTIDDEN